MTTSQLTPPSSMNDAADKDSPRITARGKIAAALPPSHPRDALRNVTTGALNVKNETASSIITTGGLASSNATAAVPIASASSSLDNALVERIAVGLRAARASDADRADLYQTFVGRLRMVKEAAVTSGELSALVSCFPQLLSGAMRDVQRAVAVAAEESAEKQSKPDGMLYGCCARVVTISVIG